jgi:DNA-binding FadR family transcriptional regulator
LGQAINSPKQNLQNKKKQLTFEQHFAIFEAIEKKEKRRASKEARKHIDFVETQIKKGVAQNIL